MASGDATRATHRKREKMRRVSPPSVHPTSRGHASRKCRMPCSRWRSREAPRRISHGGPLPPFAATQRSCGRMDRGAAVQSCFCAPSPPPPQRSREDSAPQKFCRLAPPLLSFRPDDGVIWLSEAPGTDLRLVSSWREIFEAPRLLASLDFIRRSGSSMCIVLYASLCLFTLLMSSQANYETSRKTLSRLQQLLMAKCERVLNMHSLKHIGTDFLGQKLIMLQD